MDVVLIEIKEKTLLLFHHLNQEWLLIMSPVTQDGSTAINEAKNKTKIFSSWESGENSDIKWSMLRMLTKSEGGNKENELVARHDCSSSRRTRLTRTNAKPGARIHEARARATLNNAGRVSGGCVCVLKMLTAEKMVGGHKRNWSRCSFGAGGQEIAPWFAHLPCQASSQDKQKPLLQSEFAKFPTWADLAYQGD